MSPLDPLEIPLDRRCLVEASAGTGKTFTIALLYVRLVMERGLAANEILVVTYTRAAAAELRERIRSRLQEMERALEARLQSEASVERGPHSKVFSMVEASLARGRPAEELKDLQQALRGFDEAMISTIHGFCQRMLDENAFESGAAFGTELVAQQGALVDQVVADYWTRSLYSAEPEFIRWLRATTKGGERVGPRLLAGLAETATRYPRIAICPNEVKKVEFDWAAHAQAFDAVAQLWAERGPAALEKLEEAVRQKQLRANVFKKDQIATAWRQEIEISLAHPRVGLTVSSSARGLARIGQARVLKNTRKGQVAPTDPLFEAIDQLLDVDARGHEAFLQQWLALEMEMAEAAPRELGLRRQSAGKRSYDDLLTLLADALDSEHGKLLASKLRSRFPAALIDEFQDTDPVQYSIFQNIWGPTEGSFFLIGDPKQAIYGFRGADVFAYLQARRDSAGDIVSLDRNWRSDPSLIAGVNALLGHTERPFLFDEIPFHPAVPAPNASDRLDAPGRPGGLRLMLIPGDDTGQRKNKGRARHEAASWVSQDIADLLQSEAYIESRRVEASDVAVLCRNNDQVEKMQAALRRHGIPSVTQNRRSVFETDEAADLERILQALAEPGDARAVRAAISTEWVGADASELEALQATPDRLDPWLERLDTWGARLKTHGVLAFTESLIHTANTRSRIMAQIDGERRLTNWMHLAELLQAQSGGGSTSARVLVRWVARMRRDAAARADQAGDDAIIRLESDARAVRIVTVHSSKGLQYGIVYCPFLWEGRSLRGREKAWPNFHDPDREDQLSLDLGSDNLAKHVKQAEFEAFAESVRLLYVALTRARHQVAVAWGRIQGVEGSPLAHLLHPLPRAEGVALSGPAWLEALKTHQKALEEADELLDLNQLAESSGGAIVLEPMPANFEVPRRSVETEAVGLGAARATGRPITQTRFVSSFSRLVAGGVAGGSGAFLHRLPDEHPVSAGRDYDRADNAPAWPQTSRMKEEQVPVVMHDFPAGAGPGTLIHGVLERLDFQDPDSTALDRLCAEAVQRAGWDIALVSPLVAGLDQALGTPLGGPLGDFSLRGLQRASRIDEMEFTLPVALDETAALTPRRLAEALAAHAGSESVQQYAARVANLTFGSLAGYLRGFVDLIFRHEGRYYVVDYKSNRLGSFSEDYRAANLLEEMQRHDYILQYHLYSLALHRMLSIKMPGYIPREHFGGVYYLFLRGMSPHSGPNAGVYHDRPSEEVLAALSDALGEVPSESAWEMGQ